MDNIFRIYPNPVNDFLYIISNGNYSKVKITIIDTRGNTLIINELNSDNYKIDIAVLETGVYFITIDDGKSIYTKKIVKL